MKPEHIAILVAVALVAVYLLTRKQGGGSGDIEVPAPDKLRTDLKFGYYLTGPRQIEETRGAVNLLWINLGFNGVSGADDGPQIESVAAQMRDGAQDVVLDIDHLLFHRPDGEARSIRRPDAEDALRGVLRALSDLNLLHMIKVFVMVDEPNLRETELCSEMPWATALTRAVASEFSALAGVKLGVIFFDKGTMHSCGIEHFDIIGLDNYGAKSEVLNTYDDLRRRYPGKQFWLIPGAYEENGKTYQQDLTPFLNYAHTHADVWAVVVFLWESMHALTKGARDLPVKDDYLAAGRAIVALKDADSPKG